MKKYLKLPYSLENIILMFFCAGFLGWIWECLLIFLENGILVNRGVLVGPFLPIYGWGAISAIILLSKYKDKPVFTFILIMIIASIIEYGTSVYLEYFFQAKWWDYSNHLFNLNGRICLDGALCFGMGGCFFIYYIAPLLDKIFKKFNKWLVVILAIILCIFYISDSIYSGVHPNVGNGITTFETEK